MESETVIQLFFRKWTAPLAFLSQILFSIVGGFMCVSESGINKSRLYFYFKCCYGSCGLSAILFLYGLLYDDDILMTIYAILLAVYAFYSFVILMNAPNKIELLVSAIPSPLLGVIVVAVLYTPVIIVRLAYPLLLLPLFLTIVINPSSELQHWVRMNNQPLFSKPHIILGLFTSFLWMSYSVIIKSNVLLIFHMIDMSFIIFNLLTMKQSRPVKREVNKKLIPVKRLDGRNWLKYFRKPRANSRRHL